MEPNNTPSDIDNVATSHTTTFSHTSSQVMKNDGSLFSGIMDEFAPEESGSSELSVIVCKIWGILAKNCEYQKCKFRKNFENSFLKMQ